MFGGKTKEFRDPVHGYVSVPLIFCANFIDTAIFQRLKHIEQTSMRSLFPSAHHDRFVHSLGVFHLAKTAFGHLCANTDANVLQNFDLHRYEPSFLTAALMHDCAHSPFSHIFEAHYGRDQRDVKFLLSLVDDAFQRDFHERFTNLGEGPAHHETFSAAIFLRHYGQAFKSLWPDCDPILVARMITGCTHLPGQTLQHQLENCLIRLINGPALDVDKLDYILRDTWSSGVNNVSIDIERLLASLKIAKGAERLVPVFRKAALSVIESVIDGRNYLYRWIYSHHTVWYFNQILRDAVTKLDAILSAPKPPGSFLDAVFSAEVFEHPVTADRFCAFLPSDGDIYSLLKQNKDSIPEVGELLCRTPALVPLWKTQAEFQTIFANNKSDFARSYIRSHVRQLLANDLPDDALRQRVLALPVNPSLVNIHEGDLYVELLRRGAAVPSRGRWMARDGAGEREPFVFLRLYPPRVRRPDWCVCRKAS